jgi:hypothetical protein
MTKGTDTENEASRKGSFFDPKKDAKRTINYIGMCLHNPMTPQAKKNIQNHLEDVLTLAYKQGDRDGYKQGSETTMEIWKNATNIIFEK